MKVKRETLTEATAYTRAVKILPHCRLRSAFPCAVFSAISGRIQERVRYISRVTSVLEADLARWAIRLTPISAVIRTTVHELFKTSASSTRNTQRIRSNARRASRNAPTGLCPGSLEACLISCSPHAHVVCAFEQHAVRRYNIESTTVVCYTSMLCKWRIKESEMSGHRRLEAAATPHNCSTVVAVDL